MSKQKEASPLSAKKATPEDQSWLEHSWKNQQEEPSRLEDAAKFLAGMISISLTIFLKINQDGAVSIAKYEGTSWIVVSWLLSLIFSFAVLYPFSYRFAPNSVDSIKKMHQRVVRTKQILLAVSVALFLLSLVSLGVYFMRSVG